MTSLVARLDRLGAARQTANIGAAIGRRFDYDLISAVAAKSEAEVRADLRQLTRAGLLSQSGVPPTSSYLFRHALIRDAAYDFDASGRSPGASQPDRRDAAHSVSPASGG